MRLAPIAITLAVLSGSCTHIIEGKCGGGRSIAACEQIEEEKRQQEQAKHPFRTCVEEQTYRSNHFVRDSPEDAIKTCRVMYPDDPEAQATP